MAVKPLVLTVDAQIDPFKRAMQAGKATMADFGQAAGEMAADVQKRMQEIAANPAGVASALEKSISAQIASVRRAADAAMQSGGTDARGNYTSQGSIQAAEAIEKLAVSERNRAAAAVAATAGDEREALALRQIAVAATANAGALDQQAAGLRTTASVTALVEAEQRKMGVAASDTADEVVAGHHRMSTSSMILMHAARSAGDSFAAGLPIMTIFSEQIGRLAEAAAYSGGTGGGDGGGGGAAGAFSTMAQVLGGPWGAAIIGGITIIGTIIGKMDLFTDEVGDATQKIADEAHATDVAKAAQEAYDRTLDGSIEKQRKFTEELDKRIKSQRELNAGQVGDAAYNLSMSRSQLASAQTRYNRAKAAVDATKAPINIPGLAQVRTGPNPVSDGAIAELKAATENLRKAQDAVVLGERGVRDAQVVVARANLPGQADPKVAQRQGLQNTIDDAMTRFARGLISAAARDAITIPAQRAIDALAKSKPESAGEQASIGDMTALLKQILPGVRITSTTGGKHVANSDHYAGRAIDFVPAQGMGRYSKAEMLEILEDAGVHIRRNAGGVQQFFGPGDPGHSNHFHVAWTGTASPESADRRAETAERRAQAEADRKRRDADAYTQDIDRATAEKARLAREGVADLQQLATIDKTAIDAGLAKQLDANKRDQAEHHWTDAQRQAIDLLDRENADTKKREIDRKTAQELEDRNLDAQRQALGIQARLLEIQGQLAPTLRERLAIALQLLENDRKQQLLANDKELNDHRIDPAEHDRRAADINQEHDAQGAVVRRDNAGPLEQYRTELARGAGDTNTALQNVAVDGVKSLEDGLLGVINGTESVASAFKKMATSILADLARIAIEKAILSVLGLKDGGSVGSGLLAHEAVHLADGGHVFGPGGPREDRVPAMLSAGEFVINAASTKRHRRLIEAINDNTLPHFANGGMIDPSTVAYPSLPSAASLRASGVAAPVVHQHITISSSILSTELMQHINHVGATAVAVGPGMAMDELSERNMMRIPT